MKPVSERKVIAIAPVRVDAIIHDVLRTVTGATPAREGETWRVTLPMDASMFDIRTLVVTIAPHADGSEIEATMTFDLSSGHFTAAVWLVCTVGGIPIMLAWRALSQRDVRRGAKSTFDALFSAISKAGAAAYR